MHTQVDWADLDGKYMHIDYVKDESGYNVKGKVFGKNKVYLIEYGRDQNRYWEPLHDKWVIFSVYEWEPYQVLVAIDPHQYVEESVHVIGVRKKWENMWLTMYADDFRRIDQRG